MAQQIWYNKNMKVPQWFQKLYWWGDASKIDTHKHRRTIIVQTINHGNWQQWKWLANAYGKDQLRKIIQEIPRSEFRPRALKLISLLLHIEEMKYASRGDYIKAKRGS
ncbi:MAG: hypothetical protein HYV77_02380 [Candidatus Wildermuthbacteria bacterium]|nr:hypothetical protein [Candidatus Wildermuthbacteria bacterium]